MKVGKREMGTGRWKEGKLGFPQEERILCVNYSGDIKIHGAHLPETAGKGWIFDCVYKYGPKWSFVMMRAVFRLHG